jgi:hypothetical protein
MSRAMDFWRFQGYEVPSVAELARYCMTVVTSSAAAERVFSTLKHSYDLVQMHKSLEDLTETQVMVQYNNKGEKEEEVLDL